MKENLKNKIMPVLVLLTVIFLVSSISSFQNAAKQKGLFNKETQTRMELEEQVLNLTNQNADLEQEVIRIRKDRDVLQATCLTLNQEIADLKEKLQKLAQ